MNFLFLAETAAGSTETARGILYVLYEIIWKLTYYVLLLVDEVAKLFYKVAGINVNDGVVENKNIIDQLLGQKTISTAYGILLAVALGLILVFSIVYIIKSLVKEEKKSFAPMLRNVGVAFLLLAVLGPVVLFAISMVSNLAVWIASLGGGDSISLGDAIFANSGNLIEVYNKVHPDANIASFRDLANGQFLYDLMYPTSVEGVEVVTLTYHWYIPLLGGIFILYNLVVIVFEMIKRLFNIVLLYVASPFAISKMVLDDGKSFKAWQNKLFYEFILLITQVSTFMIFVALVNVINKIDFELLANKAPENEEGLLPEVPNIQEPEGGETPVEPVTPVSTFSLLNAVGRTLIMATAASVTRSSAKMLTDIIKNKENKTDALLENVLTRLSTRPQGSTRTRTITKNTTSTKRDTVYVESSASTIAGSGGGSTYSGHNNINDKKPDQFTTHNINQNINVKNEFRTTNNLSSRVVKEGITPANTTKGPSPATIYINSTSPSSNDSAPTAKEWKLMDSASNKVANKMIDDYKNASKSLDSAISSGNSAQLKKTFDDYGQAYAKEAKVLEDNYRKFEKSATNTMTSEINKQTKEELKNISTSYRKAQMDYAKTASKLQQMNGERMSTSDALRIKEQADKQRERLMSASNQAAHFYENQKKGE